MALPTEMELGTASGSSSKLGVSHVVSDQSRTARSRAPGPELYSVFSRPQKRWIVFLAAFAGWFSTLSSFIFFPAITAIANDLHTSVEKINLTVTSYLIVSGLAPSFAGETAENYGRRPVYIVAFLIYISANVGLALQSSFPALFVIRMIQSAGISGAKINQVLRVHQELTHLRSFAITYGVVTDIASPAERGSYIGLIAFGFVLHKGIAMECR